MSNLYLPEIRTFKNTQNNNIFNFLCPEMYGTKETGVKYTSSYKVYITKENKIISPWHDIEYRKDDIITVINEIPRFTNAKFEIAKEETMNCIKQDIKKGNPRFVHNIFPMKGYPWNYGAIPQTYEDPNIKHEHCSAIGDNDPLDVIEISNISKEIGQVYQAKVIGCLALLDDGECDWKIVAVDLNDETFKEVKDIEDVNKICPGLLDMTIKWFRDYKVPDGKDKNRFALNGQFMSREFAMKVIESGHEGYKRLMEKRNMEGFFYASEKEFTINENIKGEAELPDFVNGYCYINEA